MCEFCPASFSRKYHLNRHISTQHASQEVIISCVLCGKTFFENSHLRNHIDIAHPHSAHFSIVESAFRKKFLTYRYKFDSNTVFTLHQTFSKEIINKIVKTIRYETAKKSSIRVSLILTANMAMIDGDGKCITEATNFFRGKSFIVNNYTMKQLYPSVNQSKKEIAYNIEQFSLNGSNWIFNYPICIDIQVSQTKPLAGGAKSVKDIVNSSFLLEIEPISKTDNFCFLYAIAAGLWRNIMSKKDKKKGSAYLKLIKKFMNIDGLTFPLDVTAIPQFCEQNPKLDLKINVLFMTYCEEIFPLKSNIGSGQNVVNLLLVQTMHHGDPSYHFVMIEDVNKFLRKKYRSETGDLSYKKEYFCLSCFQSFSSQSVLDKHKELNCEHLEKREVAPQPGENIVRFEKHQHKFKEDLVGYLDFECVVPPTGNTCSVCNSLRCKCDSSSTILTQEHLPIAYSFILVDKEKNVVFEKNYCGKNAAKHFLQMLIEEEEEWIEEYLEKNVEMETLTEEEEEVFNNSNVCHICDGKIHSYQEKCRDHNHKNGKFIAAAHRVCNLQRQSQKKIKIFLHNASKYDMHLLVKALDYRRIHNLRVLPYNSEHFRTISFNSFQICDSLQFLQSSLASLSSDLFKSGHDYPFLNQAQMYDNCDSLKEKEKLINLVNSGKSFFPYEFCTSLEKMKLQTSIPDRKSFYSHLTEENISVENYSHAKTVWNEYRCANLLDYTILYCNLDVFLLAEVFEAFREEMLDFSGLDPAYYISLPGFAFQSMLKITKCQLEVPTDVTMTKFIENGIRGGLAFINTRYAEGSVDRKTNHESDHLFYLDANK